MSDTQEARKQFEEWCHETMLCDPEHLEMLTSGSYRVHNVQCWWMGWEAALSRSAEPNSKIIKVALDEHGQKDLTPDEQAECVITQLQLMEKRVDELQHSEFLLEKKLESRSAEPTELIAATETLLEWLPTCSEGSSGYIRRKNVEQAVKNLKAGGSLNGSCRQEASRESDTGGESLELESRSPSTPQYVYVCSNPKCGAILSSDPQGPCPVCGADGSGWSTVRKRLMSVPSSSAPEIRCNNPHHYLTDGTPHPHEIGASCMASAPEGTTEKV